MNNVVPFESASVPAFLQGGDQANNDLLAHASSSFPIMSIKGKVFTVIRGQERAIVPNPRDPNAPACSINVVIAKVSPNTSKTFYMTAYKEGEDIKPTCFSNDGKHPDPSSEQIQCKSCAACPHNVFGTARSQDGKPGKGKACSDFVRMAICDVTNVQEPMLLRVPPASIKAVGEYGRMLSRRKVPYQAVLTEISFVPTEATPRLQFRPLGYLDEPTYREVLEVSKSEVVSTMLNGFEGSQAAQAEQAASPIPATVYGSNGQPTNAAPAVQAAAPAPAAQPAPAPAPAPAATVAATADSIIAQAMAKLPESKQAKVMNAPQPAPAPTPAAQPAPAPWEASSVASNDAELDAQLQNLGFE